MANNKYFKRQTLLSIIGVALTIICAFIAVLWETVGREAYLYKEVIVVNKDINKGDIITSGDLGVIKIEEGKMISNPVHNAKDIINLASKQFIAKNSQITKEYFDTPGVVLKDDQFIFKVPVDWVIAVPSSIRRKDTVLFYEISKSLENKQSASVTSQNNNESQNSGDNAAINTNSSIYDSYGLNLKDESWLMNFNIKDFVAVTDGKVQPPLFITTVAYVKDNANREVINVGNKERFDGSAQIGSIEVVITLKELRAMQISLEKGYKFLILSQEK